MSMCEQFSSPVPVTSRHLGHCHVCDAVAVGINFGVPTCAPCKAFFRRNAVKLGVRVFLLTPFSYSWMLIFLDRRFCLPVRRRLPSIVRRSSILQLLSISEMLSCGNAEVSNSVRWRKTSAERVDWAQSGKTNSTNINAKSLFSMYCWSIKMCK